MQVTRGQLLSIYIGGTMQMIFLFFWGGGGQSRVYLTDDQFNIFGGEANGALF